MVNDLLINLVSILFGLFVGGTVFVIMKFKKHEEAIIFLAEEIDKLRNERNQ